jgi:hypothetical protein
MGRNKLVVFTQRALVLQLKLERFWIGTKGVSNTWKSSQQLAKG